MILKTLFFLLVIYLLVKVISRLFLPSSSRKSSNARIFYRMFKNIREQQKEQQRQQQNPQNRSQKFEEIEEAEFEEIEEEQPDSSR